MSQLLQDVAAIGKKAGVSLVERTKDLNSNLGGGTARLFDAPDAKVLEAKELLASKADRNKLEGLKRLIAVRAFPTPLAPFEFR